MRNGIGIQKVQELTPYRLILSERAVRVSFLDNRDSVIWCFVWKKTLNYSGQMWRFQKFVSAHVRPWSVIWERVWELGSLIGFDLHRLNNMRNQFWLGQYGASRTPIPLQSWSRLTTWGRTLLHWFQSRTKASQPAAWSS